MYAKLTIHSLFFFSKVQIMFWSWEGIGVVQDIVSRPFNYTEQMVISTVWINVFWELMSLGGGLLPFKHLTNKKGTSLFNFQSNESFSKFLRQQMTVSKFLSDTFWENMRVWGYLPSDHSGSQKGR